MCGGVKLFKRQLLSRFLKQLLQYQVDVVLINSAYTDTQIVLVCMCLIFPQNK